MWLSNPQEIFLDVPGKDADVLSLCVGTHVCVCLKYVFQTIYLSQYDAFLFLSL